MCDAYEHILYLPHHVSRNRVPMAPGDRAAQFAPFAALTGLEAAIGERGRLTDRRQQLSPEDLGQLDQSLCKLLEMLPQRPQLTVRYFQPDPRKAGGTYVTVRGRGRHIDQASGLLLLTDGQKIPLLDVVELDICAVAEDGDSSEFSHRKPDFF